MYTPFEKTKEGSDILILDLKKSHRFIRFILFRVLPWFLLGCLAVVYNSLQKEMPGWFAYVFILGIGGLSIFLLFFTYETGITFERHRFTRKVHGFFKVQHQTIDFLENDHIEVIKEQGGRSECWLFYLFKDQKKKNLVRIPMFLDDNIASRNNLAAAFEHVCGIKVLLPDQY
ncbi:MAG: hypothetical protein MUE99_11805 [Chitinophagaceae bacterium]|nr:hypothetical protein [Chitinophagaceae bacterium]